MKAFLAPLQELGEYEQIQTDLSRSLGPIWIGGCLDSQKMHLAYALGQSAGSRLIVTYSESEARRLYEDYRFFDEEVWLYPARDLLFFDADIQGNELTLQRVRTIRELLTRKHITVITTIDACMERLAGPQCWERCALPFSVGGEIADTEALARQLVTLGYERQGQVEQPGQFAIRGGIVDLYPLTLDNPVRIELWDTEIDSIRSFDVQSQRSVEQLQSVVIDPATQELAQPGERRASFLDYLPEDGLLFVDEPARAEELAQTVAEEFVGSMLRRRQEGMQQEGPVPELIPFAELRPYWERRRTLFFSGLDQRIQSFPVARRYSLTVKGITSYQSSFELLTRDLQDWKKRGGRVILLCASRTRAERLARDLQEEYGLRAYYQEKAEREVKAGEILVTSGSLHRGFSYPMIDFSVITEAELFGGERKKRQRRRSSAGEDIRAFSELSPGDYVVHETHGLGIYQGIEKIEVDGIVKDYLQVAYAGSGRLYVPVTQLELLQKYASAEGVAPRLSSLGGGEWGRAHSRVKKAVQEMARELVALYARRQKADGFVYGPDTVWQREFEELFPYELTEGQEEAIRAVKEDMQSERVMDRLICGDVGYGKTEIAIRAAFKAVQEGRQVAYLVPTTILAQQHYNTFTQRMMNFPVRIELLSRFRTPTQQKEALAGLKRGTVDIIIGTHRLLSGDVAYKNLGLLIIDEEQRFGVAHKEKIKQLRENIDVLTLTATPIPRTLHMSLVGIRDLSVLKEAPMDRKPIQTYVMEYHDEIVREAIRRELARGGQVYFVSNRVHNILEVAARIQALVPDAAVVAAHGQMQERRLESVMLDFINGDIDVLVSTTIIETGLDIPNVNTIIIQDADRLGLSQLYQLRGRVGRASRTAYAFLMYKRDKLLREEAEKRLAAIREYTELGSGVRIAMRDLEIRGAGNVLGAEQHGHMEVVGYELYCKLLREAVLAEKGEKPLETFETAMELSISAYIPSSYIRNEAQKLDIYKRITLLQTQEDLEEMSDELIDRFGDMPQPVENLLKIARVKSLAHAAYITEVSANERELRFSFTGNAPLDTTRIPEMLQKHRGALRYVGGKAPGFLYTVRGGHAKSPEEMLRLARELIEADFLPLIG